MSNKLLSLGAIFLLSACTSQEQTKPLDQLFQASSSSSVSSPVDDHIISDFTNEPIAFSTGNLDVKIQKWTHPAINDVDDIISVRTQDDNCGVPLSSQRIGNLEVAFRNETTILYKVINPNPDDQSNSDLFYIELLPNKMAYKNVASAKKDLMLCGKTALAKEAIPIMTVNPNWILFYSTACRGYSGNNDRCKGVEKVIPKTIKLR